MWNRILGKSNNIPSTPESRRKSATERSTPRRSESLKSTTSSRKTTQLQERDRGFNPTSTSYSSTTQNQHPGTASASIGSSFATAFNDPTSDSYLPPGLVRNASLADQIPKSSGGGERGIALGSSRKSEGENEESSNMDAKRDRKERRGTRKRSPGKKSQRDSAGRSERGMSTDETAYRETRRSSRVATASDPLNQPSSQSSHVQDQFPGQFPTDSATPYRPPLAASEGGPGLAAEYYGDAGQSVADQPGHRIQSPSLIVGAEPHLQAASAVVAPPPEPSASGGVGAAASFFDGSFNTGSDIDDHHGQKLDSTIASSVPQYSSAMPPSTTYTMSASGHSNHHSASEPVIPTLGAAAAGAAAGYYMSNRPSKPEHPVHAPPSIAGNGSMAGSLNYQQSAGTHDQYASYSSSTRPPANPGKHSSQSANIPLYAAGAAGLAAATYHHDNQHSFTQDHSNGQYYAGNSMPQPYRHRHRHHGPLSKLVDFFKDPEGVAQFEEYTEYIGVCRYCFAPGSSPRDAPRKHHYRRRRSHEKFGSSVRVDKDSRYWSSENESRRRKNKSWLEAGIAGYGLGKMGESLFKQDRDFDDSHSVRPSRVTKSHRRRSSSSSLERISRAYRGVINRSTDTLPRRSRSKDRAETGMASDGKLYRKDLHGNIETSAVKAHASRHRSRSRSRDRKSRITEAALGAAVGSNVIASTFHPRSRSPKKAVIRSKLGNEADSPELASVLRLHDSESLDGRHISRRSPDSKSRINRKDRKKEKKSRGFFSFSNGSSSSASSSNLAFEVDLERKSVKGTQSKKKDRGSREADAALLGLGAAAAAALALNQNQRSKHKGELIAVKESKGKRKPGKYEHKSRKSSTSSEEDQWESASEGDWSSADSELAYGASLRRGSQESLSSDSSGLDKWGWRWGSKREAKKPASTRRQSFGVDHVSPAAGTSAAILDTAQVPSDRNQQDSRMTSSSSIPLQYVYPMPTSDPTRYDVARHDSGAPFHHSHINARPDPVPIQHPQPVAPVSQAVYKTQSPYSHSYSAPIGPPMSTQDPYPSAMTRDHKIPEGVRDQVPGAFPTGSEYFKNFMRDSNKDTERRRRDSSPMTRTSEFTFPSTGPQRRKSLKDESSSVRFDLTKEQEDKDRREERRRRKEDGKRREKREHQEIDERKTPDHDFPDRRDIVKTDERARSNETSTEESANVITDSWAAPAAAGVIAAAIGATVAAKGPSKTERKNKHNEKGKGGEDRDIEVIVKERHASSADAASREAEGRNGSSKGEAMSIWQAAAKLKRTSSYTDYAAYFTPPELLPQSSDVKRVVGANADNDITVYQVPHVVTVEPSEFRGRSASRAYSFPIIAEDSEHGKKPLPWSIPHLNLVEPTPPSSRAGSIAGSRSPQSRSPLSGKVPLIDIPLEPLESVTDANVTYIEPDHVEYMVIEPKEHREPSVDSPTTEINISESVPGISSLKSRRTHRESPPEAIYSDDLDFVATVAAGLQDTGFNPSIVIDDPSFRRRDSPPGSEEDLFPTAVVTEVTSESEDPRSPPHGFVEEIPEHHMPGSFDEDEEQTSWPHPEPRERDLESTADSDKPDHVTAELTGPSDNVGARPHVYEVEPVPIETRDLSQAAFDPKASSRERKASEREKILKGFTPPSDNARVNPQDFSAEPESLRSSELRGVAIDPTAEPQRSMSMVEENTYSSPDKVDYPSDEAPSVAATAPPSSSNGHGSQSKKKSKRRSVGFEDTAPVISAPATFGNARDSSANPDKARKGGIFGLFSKSAENLSESKGSQGIPVEANLEDFEEPKKRSKKLKKRKSPLDDKMEAAVEAEPTVPQGIEAQEDWSTSKKSQRGKEKPRSSEGATAQDSGRITQDLPAQVIAPASPGRVPLPSSSEMLTDPEDTNVDIRHHKSEAIRGLDDLDGLQRAHHDHEPSFLGERPEKPPFPDPPDTSGDLGGHLEDSSMSEKSVPPESHTESPTRTDKQKWRLSDDRSVSYPSPSPTAVPLRPLRFGRRPTSPGLTKSLPSTPQPPTTADPTFTPRRRERPHSTEFKSNEFRPIWLLEKHGSRQEPAPQESYPSLPSSHSTSRASSVHEADDLDQAQTADLVPGEFSNYQSKPGHRGLAIDTSHHEPDSELLDSQQATPTAASFQLTFKEGSAGSEETSHESGQPKLELIDVSPPADAYVDPTKEPPHDERLLHGVDDLFPQRRSGSPTRYDAVAATKASQQPEMEKPFSEEKGSKAGSGFAAMLKDAALGSFIGGSAAALLKSTSEHDEHLERSSNNVELERKTSDDEDLAAQPADTILRRPTAEEMRLMQEQDAQDAVDPWFAPAQPKRTKSKKGKKRGDIWEVMEPPPTIDSSWQATNEQRIVGADYEVPAASDEKTRSLLDDAALTTEPKQTVDALQSEHLRDIGTEAAGIDWQKALTTRKDSKGQKKKNKKKGADSWDDKSVVVDEPTAEQLSNPSAPLEGGLGSEDSAIKDRPAADLDAVEGPGSMPTDIETPREADDLPVTAAFEEFPTPARKNKKGKGRNRRSSYPETTETITPEEPLGAQLAEEPNSLALDVPAELSNTLIGPVAEDVNPASSLSDTVPYDFPRSGETGPEAPNGLLLPAEQPLSSEPELESNRTVELGENLHDTTQKPTLRSPAAGDLRVHDVLGEGVAPAAEPTDKDLLPIQESATAGLQSQVSPENVPLPLSDDLDLTQPPPDSPIIQPVDAALTEETAGVLTGERFETSDQRNEPAAVCSSSVLDSPSPETVRDKALSDSDVAPTSLTKVISELNLPERAIANQPAESAEVDVPKPQRSEVQEAGQVNDRHETVGSIAKPSSAGIEEETDWPTATKKKKKGKKGKKVQFDEPEELQPQQPEASAVKELPSAVTSTAKDVEDLIHASELERSDFTADLPVPQEAPTEAQALDIVPEDRATVSDEHRGMESFLEPKKPLGQDAEAESFDVTSRDPHLTPPLPQSDMLAAIADHRSGDFDRAPSEAYGQPVGGATASTSTAAEIQNMLARDKEQEALPTTGQDTIDRLAQPTETDDFTWAPKIKKMCKKSTSADEAVTATASVKTPENLEPEESIQEEVPISKGTSASKPVEEFSVKKSKKDKKIKRKGLSRSASDIQEEEPQSTPLAEEPKEEMAISNDAPSILEKTDQLPHIEVPTTSEAADTEVSFDPIAADEPSTSSEATPEAATEEVETTAEVPSITEKHGEPIPPAEKALEVPVAEPDNVITSPFDTEDTTIPAVEATSPMNPQNKATPDVVLPAPATDDRPLAEAPLVPLASASRVSTSDREDIGQLTKDEITDEATAPVPDEEAALQPPMSNKNKKKAKKAKAPQWEDEFPASEPGRVSHPHEVVSDTTGGPTSQAAFEAPVKIKKDKKKSKKAKFLDWLEEEQPGSLREPFEMAKSGSEGNGYETVVRETVPLEPEAVLNEETSGGTTISEGPRENTEKLEASALGENLPTLSYEQMAEPSENQTEIINPALEQASEPVNEEYLAVASGSLHKSKHDDTIETRPEVDESQREPETEELTESVIEDKPTVSEEPLKSKKDKKKAKRSRVETWEDDLPTTSTRFEGPQQEAIDMKIEEPTETIVKDNLETVEETSKSKKDKKKAKKAKGSAWGEQGPVALSAGESHQEALSAEPKTIGEQLRNAAEAQDEETVGNLPANQATMKKGKKKGKKSKFAAWNEETSIPPSRDETDQQFPGSIEVDNVTQPVVEVDETKVEKEVEVPDIRTISKKGNKKGKKSNLVAWDEEPSVPSPSGEGEQSPADSEPQPAETGVQAPPVGNEENKGDVEVPATMPEKKKDEKATKSKALALDGPVPPVSQDLAISDMIRDLAYRSEEPIPSPKATIPRDKDESVPNIDIESTLDLGTIGNDEPQAQLSTTPEITEEVETVREVTPLPAEETKLDADQLPAMMLDPHLKPALTSPMDNVETTDTSLQALTEDIEIPGGDSSMVNEDEGTKLQPGTIVSSPLDRQMENYLDSLIQPGEVHPEPVPAPSVDDAFKTAEGVIPLPSSEEAGETSQLPGIAANEPSIQPTDDLHYPSSSEAKVMDIKPEPASFSENAPKVDGGVSPLQSDENIGLSSPVSEIIPDHPNLATIPIKSAREEVPPSPQGQLIQETGLAANIAEPSVGSALVPKAESVDLPEEFPSMRRKDKKKAKKAKQTMTSEDEALEDSTLDKTMPAMKPEPESKMLDRAAAEESALLVEPTNPEAADDLPSTSRKGKKKAKKNKESFALDEERSESTTPAELKRLTEISSEKPTLPGDSETAEDVDEFAFLSKKDKKKAKKAKKTRKGLPWEDEPASTTPAGSDPVLESIDKAAEEPVLLGEADVTEAREQHPPMAKKAKKKAKKSKNPSISDDESAEPTMPAEPDPPIKLFSKTEEETLQPDDPSSLTEEMPALDKKERKKGEKGKKALTFDDEPSESTTPAELDTVPEVLENPSSPAETKTAVIIDDAPAMSNKDKKKAKKAKEANKAFAFGDEQPSETMTPVESARRIEVMDQTGEELPLPRKRTPLAGEAEDPEIPPTVEEATTFANEPQEPVTALPLVHELDRGQRTDTPVAREASPHPAALTEPVDKAVVEDEVLLEAEPDLLVSGKRSKQGKNKANKGQASDWDDDIMAREPPANEFATEASVPSVKTQLAKDTAIEEMADVPEQADFAAAHADIEQIPSLEPPVTPIVVEHELAPRHQDPAAVVDIPERSELESPVMTDQAHDRPNTAETVASPMLDSSVPPQTAISETSITPGSLDQPSVEADQRANEKITLPAVQDAPIGQDDEISSFVTMKKSKKGKKSKKQPIAWEEDTAMPPVPISEPSRAIDNESTQARPEMAAWPTEVRLNQREGHAQAQEQPIRTADVASDPAAANVLSPVPEPLEPPLVAEEGSDYFGHSPNREKLLQPEPFDDEANVATTARAPDVAVYEDSYPKAEDSNFRDSIPATTTQSEVSVKQDKEVASTAEPSDPQDVTAEPANDLEGGFSKKDKKSKRKQKKLVVDDIMWEFPSMNPPAPPPEAEQSLAEQGPAIRETIPEEEQYVDISAAPMSKPSRGAEPEAVTQEGMSREIGFQGQQEIPFFAEDQAKILSEPTISEEPRLAQAAEDDWGAVAKKGKKGRKSKKYREVAQDDVLSPQPTSTKEPEAQEFLEHRRFEGNHPEPFRQPEYQPSQDQPSATTPSGASEGIATAAALSAGLIAAKQFGRKESKKGKTHKMSRQASSNRDEQEQEPQPIIAPSNQDVDQKIRNEESTPERHRSPIQAWHQYISPSQSPKHSELYEVEEDRATSARSTRRKRSHDEQRSQVSTPDRRPPIEAWHPYNTPHHSPQQSETYDYELTQADKHSDQPASKGVNRDSAVHVLDSPLVPDRSPIHRTMRDSGYPDTEASPVIGFDGQYQERPHEELQDYQRAVDAAHVTLGRHHESKVTSPLSISSEGRDQGQQRASRTPPEGGSEQEDVNLPRHAIQPTRSLDDLREPSPVSSTTKDRSSVLFESSPSTREEQLSQEQRKRSFHYQKSPVTHGHEHKGKDHGKDDGHSPRPAARSLNTPREDNSAVVNARAESLAALSGLRQADQGQQRPSLFGGPVGISSDGTFPETPLNQDSSTRRRLNTITEYSLEESPLHKKNRDLSDVGSPEWGVKTARRSGTPQAIQERRASPPPQEPGKRTVSTDELISRPSWPAVDEDKHDVDMERSRSRGTEQGPSSHQSNISSLVSSQPKQREYEHRSLSGASNRSVESINAIIRTPPDQMRSASGMSNRSSGTPPLRRTDRSISGGLRGAKRKTDAKKRAKQPELESEIAVPPSSTKDDGESRVRDMADVYEGYGDFHASPLSPTRPPSMRRRQSMQVLELESKLDQLAAENRSLHDARQRAERSLEDASRDRGQEVESYREGIETRDTWLRQKDAEITHLNETLESLQSQIAHLTEVNEGLHAASRELGHHQERYRQLEEEHADTHQRWQQSTRELEALRDQHAQLSAGMEDIVRHEVNTAVEEKNIELRRLSDELDAAKQQIRTLQQQILASKRSDDSIIPDRDEDYFDAKCQTLCQHVQQWVLRFSKFSDNRACYLASEIRDEKIVDRMENAILDGSDPDDYLADRVKRRDVFMSMVMTMTWEFIFTRYLFGADREQRQKLKSLEKQLSESANVTMSAVHKWRATTLALLSKREQFVNQRSQDTEAVMHTIYDTLATILPPPSHLVPQIQQSLRKVLASAVDLSVEMRTQRAEYVMLPPLQPEYDTNGDLARRVYFNAALMNERSGMTGVSNEELEAKRAVVRMVLFPLVVKKGDGGDDGEEEIVVCPAQVLVAAEEEKGKRVQVVSASEQGGSDVGMVNMF
ncbi:MAG: hypothetical protein LQ343_004630 [Gyalolechia ehrenbergii]|nr:MAG: hypothetical protein LQ343_004630 [Gyalolechia ehrenbergii]